MMISRKLDSLDIEILHLLQSNCKMSVSELAKKLNRPRTTIASRLSKLVSSGIIRTYRAILDYNKLGFNLTALIFVTARRGNAGNQVTLARRIIEECKNDSDLWIEEVSIITGRYDIVFKVRVKKLENLTNFLINFLPRFKDVEHTETFIVLHIVDEYRPAYLKSE